MSLIPSVITLCDFWIKNFPNIFWYPNWYLGNPYNFLIGPAVPFVLYLLSKALLFPLLYLYFGLIFASMLAGGLGIYLLLKEFGASKLQSIISGSFYVLLPLGLFILNFQNGLKHISLAVLPFSLLFFLKFLKKDRFKTVLILALTIFLALLIEVNSLLSLAIGFIAVGFSVGIKLQVREKIIKTILIFLTAIFLSSIWYSFRFWWVILTNSSFGGVPLINLIFNILRSLLNFLPVVLAIIFFRRRKYKPEGQLLFAFIFTTAFVFLSIIRFMADPDFVMDWIGFSLEIQLGLSIILASVFSRPRRLIFLLSISTILIIAILLDCYIVNNLTIQQYNNKSAYQTKISNLIKNNVKDNQRIFLSGSSVFWINRQTDVLQVRGGSDNASINPFWAHAAYQIREGEDKELLKNWFEILGASYVLTHGDDSEEPFRDLKNLDRFSQFKLISKENGDNFYQIKNSGIARVADVNIFNIPRPVNGADLEVLNSYVESFNRPTEFSYVNPQEISIKTNLKQDEAVSLAITYDPRWSASDNQTLIKPDSVGNMIIVPQKKGEQRLDLSYRFFWQDIFAPIFLSALAIIALIYYRRIDPFLIKFFPKLSLGLDLNEEEDY